MAEANSTHHLNLYVAYEKGLFAKRGLDVEIQQTSSGVAAGHRRLLCKQSLIQEILIEGCMHHAAFRADPFLFHRHFS
ncbi:MAG: ABC transporter substrate-binding protein, partial [Treponema sp.]|nr:ABC transporter substrate-binding protein [Treponema sp.]